MRIKHFEPLIDRIAWFDTVGEAFPENVRTTARAYLDELGYPHADIAQITSWEEAADAAQNLDIDSDAWAVEEQLRAGLVTAALEQMEEDALQIGLTHISSKAAETVRETMDQTAAIWDVEDDGLITAAIGAAVQACHNAALLLAAGEEDPHPFAFKYQLFEAGRWPIAVTGQSFNLF